MIASFSTNKLSVGMKAIEEYCAAAKTAGTFSVMQPLASKLQNDARVSATAIRNFDWDQIITANKTVCGIDCKSHLQLLLCASNRRAYLLMMDELFDIRGTLLWCSRG